MILMLSYLAFWLLLSLRRGDGKWRKRFWSIFTLTMMLVTAVILMCAFPNAASAGVFNVSLLALAQRFAAHVIYFYPLIFIEYAFATLLLVYHFFRRSNPRQLLFSFFLLIFVTGFYASCFFHFVPIARYSALIDFVSAGAAAGV